MTNGRPQEAVLALRAIAKYNNLTMDITSDDVYFGDAPTAGDRPLVMKSKDKKDSELPSPAAEDFDERQRLPGTTGLSFEGSSTTPTYESVSVGQSPAYDSVGKGMPPRRQILRTGSAFYAETPMEEGQGNHFERSFMAAATDVVEETEEDGPDDRNALLSPALRGSIDSTSVGGKEMPARSRGRSGMFAWWFSWMEQLGRLFVPQWRRTVLLMWVIWGSMSFGELSSKHVRLVAHCQRTQCLTFGCLQSSSHERRGKETKRYDRHSRSLYCTRVGGSIKLIYHC